MEQEPAALLAFQARRGLGQMLGGRIPIHGLPAGVELLRGQVPDPRGAIAQRDRVAGVQPMTLARLGPHPLAEQGGATQMRHVTVAHGVCPVERFASLR